MQLCKLECAGRVSPGEKDNEFHYSFMDVETDSDMNNLTCPRCKAPIKIITPLSDAEIAGLMRSVHFQKNLQQLVTAMNGYADKNPVDQARLATRGLEWVCLMLSKNRDYGSAAWASPILCPGMPPGVGIRVRLSDKIARLANLFGLQLQADGKYDASSEAAAAPHVSDESIEQTMEDLAVYSMLWLTRPEE